MKHICKTILVIVFFALFACTGLAQDEVGRWTLGLHGGINVWESDYNQHKIGDGGEFMFRYGLTDWFSAGVVGGYEELKASEDPGQYPGLTSAYLKDHAITLAMQGFLHFAPHSGFDPYITAGLGSMLYKRINGLDQYVPNSQFHSSVLVPLGVGVEIPVAHHVALVAEFDDKITDDYPDNIISKQLNSFLTMKIGINFILGGSDRRETAELPQPYLSTPDTVVKTNTVVVNNPPVVIRDTVTKTVFVPTPVVKDTVVQNTVIVDKPIILERGKTVILKGINFESGKATLTMDSKDILHKAYLAMVASPDVQVQIAGHTDSVGNRAYNRDLSVRRAKAVKSWMVDQGIDASRMTTIGRGMDEPIDVNSTPEGRANNRRIEFRVQQ